MAEVVLPRVEAAIESGSDVGSFCPGLLLGMSGLFSCIARQHSGFPGISLIGLSVSSEPNLGTRLPRVGFFLSVSENRLNPLAR